MARGPAPPGGTGTGSPSARRPGARGGGGGGPGPKLAGASPSRSLDLVPPDAALGSSLAGTRYIGWCTLVRLQARGARGAHRPYTPVAEQGPGHAHVALLVRRVQVVLDSHQPSLVVVHLESGQEERAGRCTCHRGTQSTRSAPPAGPGGRRADPALDGPPEARRTLSASAALAAATSPASGPCSREPCGRGRR